MLKPWLKKGRLEAGCDEAGRGSLAGPVVAAVVILPPGFNDPRLNDSKLLSARRREILRSCIEKSVLDYAIGVVEPGLIDQMNILQASILAMHRALDKLHHRPAFILVDGNRFRKYKNIPHQCFVRGDRRFQSIAAASILAKTYRDELMIQMDTSFPQYLWKQNKGYPTRYHRQAIRDFGITHHHRKSFRLLDDQLSLEF
jgi:ribonuclease HII